ncbi:MAG: DUF2889 domain-containing protein [Burkholderiaceae bacterium]
MTLSAPAPRIPRHTRHIHCEGYLRDDGLWDIEASIIDTKAYPYAEPYRGLRPVGSEVHHMAIRLTLDDSLEVKAIEVQMPQTPYPDCPGAARNFQSLVGARVGAGWRRIVNEKVGGTRGCTHVRELLFPMATVAFQTIRGWPEEHGQPLVRRKMPDDQARQGFVDGCHAWAADGEMIADLYPALSTRDKPG